MSVLSHRFVNFYRMTIVCLLCVGMLAACGRTRPVQSPPGTEPLPPIIEVQPDQASPMLKVQQPQRIRQIHERLFQEAQDSFEAQRFQDAIRELTRLLGLHPQADLEREGRWWLGRSYDQVKDWDSAQHEYRRLASAPTGQRYQSNSSQRLKEIQELLEEKKRPPKNTQAIRFALNQLPSLNSFDQGIMKMKQDGVTTLLIDLGCEETAVQSSSSSNAERLSEIENLKELLRSYAKRSHRIGLFLYVGVNLRCLGQWAPSQHQAWRDRMYQEDTGTLTISKRFDLFHPAYQEFLTRFLAQLCQVDVDGLIFLNDHPLGVFDGVTQVGLKRFKKKFGVGFEPTGVFYPGFDPSPASKKSQKLSSSKGSSTKDSLFWRWAGWKARERLTILEAVVNRLRLRHPTVQFGLELHPHSLTHPVDALVQYAEDAMDAARRSFSFFFVRPEIDRRSTFTQQSVIEKLRRISTKAVLDRLLPVVDDPRRVWVSMPAQGGKRLRPQARSNEASPLHNFPAGIGVVHDLRAFS